MRIQNVSVCVLMMMMMMMGLLVEEAVGSTSGPGSGNGNSQGVPGVGSLSSINGAKQDARLFAAGYTAGCGIGVLCEVTNLTVAWTCVPNPTLPTLGSINAIVCDTSTLAAAAFAGDTLSMGAAAYPDSWYVIALQAITVAARYPDNTKDLIAGNFSSTAYIDKSSGATSLLSADLLPSGCVKAVITGQKTTTNNNGEVRVVAAGCFTQNSDGHSRPGVAILGDSWSAPPTLPAGVTINPVALAYDPVNDEVAVVSEASIAVLTWASTNVAWKSPAYSFGAMNGTILAAAHSSTLGYIIVGNDICVSAGCGPGPFAFSQSTQTWSLVGGVVFDGFINTVSVVKGVLAIGGSFSGPDGVPRNFEVYDSTGTWVPVSTSSDMMINSVLICAPSS